MLDLKSATLRETLSPLLSDEAKPGHIAIDDPSTGRTIASIQPTDEREIDRAIARAERAQRDWMKRTMRERAAFLIRVSEALAAATDDFAKLITLESGKPSARPTMRSNTPAPSSIITQPSREMSGVRSYRKSARERSAPIAMGRSELARRSRLGTSRSPCLRENSRPLFLRATASL